MAKNLGLIEQARFEINDLKQTKKHIGTQIKLLENYLSKLLDES